jgi:hypothetical protein
MATSAPLGPVAHTRLILEQPVTGHANDRQEVQQPLERARWPNRFVCPKCGTHGHARFLAHGCRYRQCSVCRTRSTERSGTLFHASELPLARWFKAIHLVIQKKNHISARSLKRHLGVAEAAAWRVKHKSCWRLRARVRVGACSLPRLVRRRRGGHRRRCRSRGL